jgi:hypothetical protein
MTKGLGILTGATAGMRDVSGVADAGIVVIGGV